MELCIAEPHGMCSGVARALRMAEQILAEHPGETLWCFHEIVHNEHVVNGLKARGVRFVKSLQEIPTDARVLFSAHGVSPQVRAEALARRLAVVDATCPFVTKVHREAKAFSAQGAVIALIGHKGHDEVEGIVGEAPAHIHVIECSEDVAQLRKALECSHASEVSINLVVLSQTTVSREMVQALSAELAQAGFSLTFPAQGNGICYATQERQEAVRGLAKAVDHLVVLGSRTSSNSLRLAEVAERAGCPVSLVASPNELDLSMLTGVRRLGITSGASTPEALLRQLVQRLEAVSAGEERIAGGENHA